MKRLLVGLLICASFLAKGQKRLESFLADTNRLELKSLDLHRCDLKEIPPSLWDCVNLEKLDLSKNDLQTIPAEILKLRSLKVLILSKNDIKHLPFALRKHPNLEEIQLDQNPIDSLIVTIGDFPKLNKLDLWDAQVRYISPEICELKNLKWMDLRRNFLGTRDLKWLFECLPKTTIESTWGCDCD